jgi:mannose/cellobiose epimerase-like protein (N-acyl-D-glucosamine 2-epimerase family)
VDLAAETIRLLEFGRAARVRGGFAWLDDDGAPDPSQPLPLWITARMTHVYALGHALGRPGCAELVDHGVAALEDTFEDRRAGGWFRSVDDTTKAAYEHAFVLLAAASAATVGHAAAQSLLGRAADVVLRRFWSEADGRCRDEWDRDWQTLDGYRGANANMHSVEAFLAAADATGDEAWRARALQIAERLIDQVAREHDWRLPEHFDGEWRPLLEFNRDRPRDPFRPFGVTPGHGLEWSRLLLHLRASLREPPDWLLEASRALFERATADGWEANGGVVYTTDHDGRPVVRDRFHWVIAEGIAAAGALGRVTGDEAYEGWYRRFWEFAEAHLIDRQRGSWRHELDGENRPAGRTWHGKPDLYHAVQATLVPRLPLAPTFARALTDGLLASA